MATITKAQYERWNSQLSNGFQFDLQHFLVHGEKEARKTFKLDGGKVLEARLSFTPVYEHFRLLGYQPTLDIQLWHPASTEGMMVSSGLGVHENLGIRQQRKQYNILCQLCTTVTDEQIKQIAAAEMKQLNNGRIL